MKNTEKREQQESKWKQRLKWYLSTEIGIEYKSCLYFFAILFFESMYLLVQKIYAVSLLHMAEIILAAYGMGYFQVLVLDNFDEAETFGKREIFSTLLCTGLYTGISYLGGWFDRQPVATGIFALYCAVLYVSAYLANKVKRDIDTEQLNVMLQAYQGTLHSSQRGGKRDDKRH